MTHAEDAEMSPAEIDAFLDRTRTGVISLAREGEPYAVPISYGYDTDDRTFYVRLVSTPGSRKRSFLDSSPAATLVVSEAGNNGTHRSVLATGYLERVDPEELSPAQITQYGAAERPLFELWGVDRADLDIQLYELHPTELTGRQTAFDRD